MIIFPGRKLLDINILSINIIRQNQDFLDTESYVFEFQYQWYKENMFYNDPLFFCSNQHFFFFNLWFWFF